MFGLTFTLIISTYPDSPLTECVICDLVCLLMEWQDRMTDTFFLKLNDLEYRVDDLELCEKSRAIKQSDIKKVAGN